MRNALVKSILFHVTIVAISYFGLPFVTRTPMMTDAPIMVEIVNVDEMTNAPPPKPAPEKKPDPKAKKQPEPPKQVKAAPPPPPPPAREKEVAALPAEPLPKPKEQPKPVAKEPEKPTPQFAHVTPKRKPKPPDAFTSVLKTVEKLKAQPKEKEKEKEKKKTEPKQEPFEQQIAKALTSRTADHNPMRPLAISEIDLVRQQIRECWNLPAGAKDAQDLNIEIHVVMNPDATVREARIQNQSRLQRDPFFRAAAESALRAVLNPKCNPLKLPPEKYQQWQTMTLNFDPREMF